MPAVCVECDDGAFMDSLRPDVRLDAERRDIRNAQARDRRSRRLREYYEAHRKSQFVSYSYGMHRAVHEALGLDPLSESEFVSECGERVEREWYSALAAAQAGVK